MRVVFTKTRFPATRVVGIIHGCPCISLDIHGCLQPSMDFSTYVRKDIQGYPWTYIYLHTHDRRVASIAARCFAILWVYKYPWSQNYKAFYLKGENWAPPSFLLGAHFTIASRHKNGTKTMCQGRSAFSGGPLYDRMLAQNSIKHCTRKTNH